MNNLRELFDAFGNGKKIVSVFDNTISLSFDNIDMGRRSDGTCYIHINPNDWEIEKEWYEKIPKMGKLCVHKDFNKTIIVMVEYFPEKEKPLLSVGGYMYKIDDVLPLTNDEIKEYFL